MFKTETGVVVSEFKSISVLKDSVIQHKKTLLRYEEKTIPLNRVDTINGYLAVRTPLLVFGFVLLLIGLVVYARKEGLTRLLTLGTLGTPGGQMACVGILLIITAVLWKQETVEIRSGSASHITECGAGALQFAHEIKTMLGQMSETHKADSPLRTKTESGDVANKDIDEYEADEPDQPIKRAADGLKAKLYNLFRR